MSLITLLIVVLIACLIWYLIGLLPVGDPAKRIIRIIFIVICILYLISLTGVLGNLGSVRIGN